MEKQFVAELIAGNKVASYFAVVSKQLASFSARSSKAGQEYLRVILKDSTGTIEGVIWDDALLYFPVFEVDDIVFVEGTVSHYRGLQITISSIKYVPPENVDISLFVSPPPVDVPKLRRELAKKIEAVDHPFLQKLLRQIFSGKMLEEFCNCPGGKSIHHAFSGGLLKHTLEVVSIVQCFAHIHASLDPDILVAGALLHDIGKTREYDLKSISFRHTDQGQLSGHLVLGRDILLEATSVIPGFPSGLEEELGHMLLSHHGQREWGSPEVPKTLEALALFYADLSSARLDQSASIINETDKAKWSNWNKLFERSFFNPSRKYSFPESEPAAFLEEE